jgi:integrase
MGSIKLTDTTVASLTCPAGKKDIMFFDAMLKGFGLRVTSKGAKVFLYQYRAGTAVRRHRLGEWPTVTVAKARKAAEGLDKPAAKLARSDAAAILKAFAQDRGPIGANRLMACSRACYGWGIKADLVTFNPFVDLAPPGREKARERALNQAEVTAVWRACEALENPQRGFVRLLLLTLQRRSEVAGAVWGEFSDDLATWTIPAARAKNGRTHLVHMAPAAQVVLASLTRTKPKKVQSAGDMLVFSLLGGSRLTAFSVIKRAIVEAVAKTEMKAAAATGREPTAMPPWTFHDFRRSGVTALAGLGFAPHVCDRLLNHVTGAIQGVAAVYQRAEFLAERKAALEAWAGFVVGTTPR